MSIPTMRRQYSVLLSNHCDSTRWLGQIRSLGNQYERNHQEVNQVSWLDYMETVAAPHSRDSAAHWFRYLRKDIDKCGIVFSKEDVEALYHNEALTPFQRISIKAAFEIGSPTREHIRSLNRKSAPSNILAELRAKYGSND